MIRLNMFRVTGPKGTVLMLQSAFTRSTLSIQSGGREAFGALQHNSNMRPSDKSTVYIFLNTSTDIFMLLCAFQDHKSLNVYFPLQKKKPLKFFTDLFFQT